MDNHNDYISTINVFEGSITNIENILIPIEGCISFESFPSGAELTIQGVGKKFEYHLKLNEYKTFNGCITLVPGHGENISHSLAAKTGKDKEENEY